jgi:hypothetical protein
MTRVGSQHHRKNSVGQHLTYNIYLASFVSDDFRIHGSVLLLSGVKEALHSSK